MELNQKLFELFADKAKRVTIDQLCIGLGYTAVTTSDGGIGISYTYFDSKTGCTLVKGDVDYEGRLAVELLESIQSNDPMRRSMAMALINALNYEKAILCPQDGKNRIMFDAFNIFKGAKVAMVGFFPPLAAYFKDKKVPLEVIDDFRGMGRKDEFYEKLKNWADVLFLTATSILNNTTEAVISHAGPGVKTIILGPTTPMAPKAFAHLPVHMLAGTTLMDKEKTLKAVRHGLGTKAIQKHGKKTYCMALDPRP